MRDRLSEILAEEALEALGKMSLEDAWVEDEDGEGGSEGERERSSVRTAGKTRGVRFNEVIYIKVFSPEEGLNDRGSVGEVNGT